MEVVKIISTLYKTTISDKNSLYEYHRRSIKCLPSIFELSLMFLSGQEAEEVGGSKSFLLEWHTKLDGLHSMHPLFLSSQPHIYNIIIQIFPMMELNCWLLDNWWHKERIELKLMSRNYVGA